MLEVIGEPTKLTKDETLSYLYQFNRNPKGECIGDARITITTPSKPGSDMKIILEVGFFKNKANKTSIYQLMFAVDPETQKATFLIGQGNKKWIDGPTLFREADLSKIWGGDEIIARFSDLQDFVGMALSRFARDMQS